MSGLQRSYIYLGRGGGPERLVSPIDLAYLYLRSTLSKEAPVYEYFLDDYFDQIIQLLPRGVAWDAADDGDFGNLLYGIVTEYTRISDKIIELENDTFPQNTTQLLPDWERVLGLPDECTAGIAVSTTERRAAVITKLAGMAEPTPAFFQNMALDFGYAIEIVEYFPARVGIARIGDAINGPGSEFTWAAKISAGYTQSRRALIGDTQIGDRIATWGDGSLECLLRQYKPAHTTLVFLYD
jgi:uncharacterized protein YmfQ (DUF2313 family)